MASPLVDSRSPGNGIARVFQRARGVVPLLSFACGAVIAAPSTLAPPPTPRPLTPETVGLSVESFYQAFSSPDDSTREKAYLYLLGVQDLTEGRAWCEYRRFKTVTLREVVGEYIQALPKSRLSERAAVVIEEALKTKLPCGGTKR
jgi:hypothetical protein